MLDKDLDRYRYNLQAERIKQSTSLESFPLGSSSFPLYLRSPYTDYEQAIKDRVKAYYSVLEIGSGTGEFTGPLVTSGAFVVATDISEASLEILKFRYNDLKNLAICTCDMEMLPFSNDSFDVIVSAGSLSYGDNRTVMLNITRLLKRGGFFICVDSFNHNPIYRLNRFIHYLAGQRTINSLKRLPTQQLINEYQSSLRGHSLIYYYGMFSWFFSLLDGFCSHKILANLSNFLDGFFKVRLSAFKVMLILKKE